MQYKEVLFERTVLMSMDYKKVQFSGYKSFYRNDKNILDAIGKVNVIIGKNNSGKSSLLDIIEFLYDSSRYADYASYIHACHVSIPISKEMVKDCFRGYRSIGNYTENSYWDKVQGKYVTLDYIAGGGYKQEAKFISDNEIPIVQGIVLSVEREFHNQLSKLAFRRLSAERNIVPEDVHAIHLSNTGEGATNLIREYLNNSNLDEKLIEKKLLGELNKIMAPEAIFSEIRVQEIKDKEKIIWEVYLQEEGQERVALSKSGSGLKTIILVLLNLMIMPELEEYKNRKIVYGFEELENNLHPALQRRLFDYLYNYAILKDTRIFITTHSHVAINAFFGRDDTQIYHVIKENGHAALKKIDSFIDKVEILDDLDVKASDILQSNGIVWVEGPSDRIYIKRWLEVFTENDFIEGKDYQFLYYGGKTLANYSLEENPQLINILTTNHNAAIIMDSDKRNRQSKLNDTKKRVIEEFGKLGMFCWVTKGKEIENYISCTALSKALGKTLKKQCGQYQLFPDYIKIYYKSFSNQKVAFSKKVSPYIDGDNAEILDIKKQITALYNEMRKWNK